MAQLVAVMVRHTALIHLVLLEIIKAIHGVLTHSALQEAVMVQVVALTLLVLCGATDLVKKATLPTGKTGGFVTCENGN